MKKYQTIVESIIILIGSVAVMLSSLLLDNFGELALSPGLFPFFLGGLLLVLAIVKLVQGIHNQRVVLLQNTSTSTESANKQQELLRLGKNLAIVIGSLVYILGMNTIGFIISTFFYVFLIMVLLGERRWWVLMLFPICASLLVYVAFDIGLNVYLPK